MVKPSFLIFSVLMFFSVLPLSAQEDYRSRIVIVPMENGTGSEQYNPLCSTITDTVSLVLEFLKDYRVLGEEDINLAKIQRVDPSDRELIKKIALEEGVDEIVYGNMLQQDDVFQFTISLYNVKKGRITNSETAEAFSVLEVFDAGDELTAGLIAQLSDVKIAFGSISLIQTGGKGNYTVNLDSYPLRNPDKTFKKVLNGEYEISISQKRLTSVETIFSKIVEVLEDQETVVEFTIPPGSPEEFQWMEEQGTSLLALGENEDSFDQFMEELTIFQNKTLALEYDRDLENLRKEYLEQAGRLARATLQKRMDEADDSFYSKKARFDESLLEYEGISAFVKTEYDVKLLSSSKDLVISEPQKVQTGSGNLVYFSALDNDSLTTLFQWNPENSEILYRDLKGEEEQHYQGDFYVSGWKLYLWEPGSTDVLTLDDTLSVSDVLPIPDLAGGNSGLKLAVSGAGLVYLISDKTVRVIDTARELDESGEIQLPDRYYSIENNLQEILGVESGGPGDIFFDKAGHLNIFYPETGLLYITDARGLLLKSLRLSLTKRESRIAVDETGFYYVTLYDDNQIAKYTPEGDLITSFGHYGTDRDQFSLPTGIAVSPEGDILVADSYNARIKILKPLNHPVVYPEIARYSSDLDRRIDRNKLAVKKDKAARAEVNWKTHTGNIVTTSALLGSSFGLVILQDYFANNAANYYFDYQHSIEPRDVEDYRKSSEMQTALQVITEIGGITAFGMAGVWATETFLKIGLDTTLTRYNRKQIQNLDMNDVYETDPDKYRSIRSTSRIGVWTGIVPPVLGLIGATSATVIPNSSANDILVYSVLGGIISPPIFSHLHGGRFNLGLLLAGLSADLFALWGLVEMEDLISADYKPWETERYDIGNPRSISMSRVAERIGETKGLYLLSAAFGIRLAAGIFDARYGWTYTNSYNRYKAVRPKDAKETAANFNVNPYLNEAGGPGLALKVSF